MTSSIRARTSLNEDDLKSLDTIRRSLLTLTNSLTSLQHSISTSQSANAPFPPWSSLQNSFAILTGNLLQLSEYIDNSRDFLTRAHAYPLPSFPGREQEALLSQLLKKKADVEVEKWMRKAEEKGEEITGGHGSGNNEGSQAQLQSQASTRADEIADLWEWALQSAGSTAKRIPWGIDVTMEERERTNGLEEVKAKSGLKKELKVKADNANLSDEDSDESENEDRSAKMDVDHSGSESQKGPLPGEKDRIAPMIPLEDVLRFMITGAGRNDEDVTMTGALG